MKAVAMPPEKSGADLREKAMFPKYNTDVRDYVNSTCYLYLSLYPTQDRSQLYKSVGAIDRAQARSTSARNMLLTVRMRTDRAHALPPSEHKCMKV